MSIRPSALNNSAHTGRIFMKFGFWVFFETIARKLKFYYNRTRITDTLLKTNINLWSYLAHFFLEWEMFRTKVVEEIKTHILSSTTFFLNHTVYETRCKNIVQPEGPQMTIWRMRIACRIAKATHTKPHTHTLRMYNTYCFSTATMVARTRLSVALYVHCLYCSLCNWHIEVSALKQVLICRFLLLNLLTQTQNMIFCIFSVSCRHVTHNDLLMY
jgi:hypothetical protein